MKPPAAHTRIRWLFAPVCLSTSISMPTCRGAMVSRQDARGVDSFPRARLDRHSPMRQIGHSICTLYTDSTGTILSSGHLQHRRMSSWPPGQPGGRSCVWGAVGEVRGRGLRGRDFGSAAKRPVDVRHGQQEGPEEKGGNGRRLFT
ncbi:hypothetical protein GGR56DRAFT_611880 [Xylariaceae sp. FL0804]|nr:hypothetical protein GGR56DRAFT_611880 [Xylariaceae sp. FL0804]